MPGSIVSESNAAVDMVFAFTGKLFDENTQLQNNLFRWYDAATGQWMSEDPLGFAAGDENIRRYVRNTASALTDPSGLRQRQAFLSPGVPAPLCDVLDPEAFQLIEKMIVDMPFVADGDWLDRNFGGGGWGAPDASGTLISIAIDVASIAPIAGEIHDIAQFLTGIGNNGERLTTLERGLTLAGVVVPLVGAGFFRRFGNYATKHVDDIVKQADVAPVSRMTAAETTARDAAQGFPNFECFACSDAIEEGLVKAGQSGHRVSFDRHAFGEYAMISSKAFPSDVISESGLHDAVLVDRYIFDNHNPNGVLPLNFFFQTHVGPPIRPLNVPMKIDVKPIESN